MGKSASIFSCSPNPLLTALRYSFLVFLLLLNTPCHTQSVESKNISVFLEGGGPAYLGSINLEYSLKYPFSINPVFRAGLCTYPLRDFTNTWNPNFVIPLLFGCHSGSIHRIILEFGTVYSNYVVSETGGPVRKSLFSISLPIAYRYCPQKLRLWFQLEYAPLFNTYRFQKHWGGIALGYRFR